MKVGEVPVVEVANIVDRTWRKCRGEATVCEAANHASYPSASVTMLIAQSSVTAVHFHRHFIAQVVVSGMKSEPLSWVLQHSCASAVRAVELGDVQVAVAGRVRVAVSSER